MFAVGQQEEVKGTGVWSMFKMSRDEDGEISFGDAAEKDAATKSTDAKK